MARQRTPEELFPNLFGKRPASRQSVVDIKPSDMRLLQYTMQQAGRRPEERRSPSSHRMIGKA